MITTLSEDIPPEGKRTIATDMSRINFIVGMNGCGKSTFLRGLPNGMIVSQDGQHVLFSYIEPERGGSLRNDQNTLNRPQQSGHSNQDPAFRQKVISEFNDLHRELLNELVDNKEKYTDNTHGVNFFLKPLNNFLPNLAIAFAKDGSLEVTIDGKTISTASSNNRVNVNVSPLDDLSSGQLEAISLGIKVFNFAFDKKHPNDARILLIDSPDAHFHPDLQHRFSAFVNDMCETFNFQAIIATHSTAMIDKQNPELRVAFVNKENLRNQNTPVSFISPNSELNKVLPIFGAHPLSQAFNEKAILLVEGDDDMRIWEQVYRSSNGGISLPPLLGEFNRQLERIRNVIRAYIAINL